jgi:hypothetical protein
MSEEGFWLWFWAIVILGIVSFSAIIAIHNYNTEKMYIENGYSREAIVRPNGYSSVEWVKK